MNTFLTAQLDERYTEFQRSQSVIYGVHPGLFPPELPTEPLNLDPSGYRRGMIFSVPAPAVDPAAALAQRRQDLAAIFGVQAKYIVLEGE